MASGGESEGDSKMAESSVSGINDRNSTPGVFVSFADFNV